MNANAPTVPACVSVIVPVYNCERYLERCLRSLAAQSLRELEFVVVDDGSTDRSGGIIDRFAAEDSRFVVLRQENAGVASARNVGLDAAQGEYLGFVDSDDYVEPDCFETLYRRAVQNEADLIVCNYYVTLGEKENIRPFPVSDGLLALPDFGWQSFYLARYTKEVALWNHLIRRELVTAHQIRFETDRGEDALFHIRLLPHLRRVAFVERYLYHYVQRRDSLTRRVRRGHATTASFVERYAEHPLSPAELEAIAPLAQEYVLVMLSTCLLYSYGDADRSFFQRQIEMLRCLTGFEVLCESLNAGRMGELWTEGAMTQRMYRVQRSVFSRCHAGKDREAARLMWLGSRYQFFKRAFFL